MLFHSRPQMSAATHERGTKRCGAREAEAAAILALISRASWSDPALEEQIVAMLCGVDRFPAERFVDEFLRAAISVFFGLAYYDGGRRRIMIDALDSLTRVICAEPSALSKLHFAGIGDQFEAAPRSARQRALDREEKVAKDLLSQFRGTGHDETRPVMAFVRALADGWDQCGGPAITWNGKIDFDDQQSEDAHLFFEIVLFIFEHFRKKVAAAGPEPIPTVFAGLRRPGASPFKAIEIPDQGSVVRALRITCSNRVPKSSN
jgi:hypothetical protein